MQARQYTQCAWNDELLSRVSEESTQWSRERAHQAAVRYWRVLKEEQRTQRMMQTRKIENDFYRIAIASSP